jgi:hypothetical protein
MDVSSRKCKQSLNSPSGNGTPGFIFCVCSGTPTFGAGSFFPTEKTPWCFYEKLTCISMQAETKWPTRLSDQHNYTLQQKLINVFALKWYAAKPDTSNTNL